MLALFYAPDSRSTAIVTLIAAMGLNDRTVLHEVTIPCLDRSRARSRQPAL